LHGLVPSIGERLLYCGHVEGRGEELFHLVCQRDLEGIVAKRKFDPYLPAKRILVEDPQPEVFPMGRGEKSCLSGKGTRNLLRDAIPAPLPAQG
jgi:hypothetical protein